MMLLAALRTAKERRAGGVLEHFTYTLASLGGTLQVVPSTDLLLYCHAL